MKCSKNLGAAPLPDIANSNQASILPNPTTTQRLILTFKLCGDAIEPRLDADVSSTCIEEVALMASMKMLRWPTWRIRDFRNKSIKKQPTGALKRPKKPKVISRAAKYRLRFHFAHFLE
jgi:hypothetical protein